MLSSTFSPIPQIWRNISLSGNLERKQGNGSGASTPSYAAREASSSSQNELLVPIPVAALRSSPFNGQGSRFVEDLEALVAGEEAAGPSRRPGITIIENSTQRPAERQPPSRPPSPYVVKPPTPVGSSHWIDPEGWALQDEEQWDAARACQGWVKAFGDVRRRYEGAVAGLFGKLERLWFFSFNPKYRRFLNTIEAVEASLDALPILILDSDWNVYGELSNLIDFFAAWIIEAHNCCNTMTLDGVPVNLDNPEQRAGRKSQMVEMGPELARLTERLSDGAQKPLRKLRALLKEFA
ncbi:uncharacterized protein PV07_09084 [Cladophialophora immunda]|uniref:Uncharacterized protein n=1 Tax=Cladophialophora immunda TaxID=569365 RepID=A0A0D2C643_9EURO|nr:uncharacterized protein PV07_09084 [Cladophialophora immunda]KIW25950.1 hypothetical protein PV07_09084 [Cladophialophora immunda]